jgi:CHASE3 domain sensor protein
MRHMTIGRQMAAGFAACLAAVLLIAVVGGLALEHVASTKNRIIEERAPLVSQVHELAAAQASKSSLRRGFLISGDEGLLARLEEVDTQFKQVLARARIEGGPQIDRQLSEVAANDQALNVTFGRLADRRREAGSVDQIADRVERSMFAEYEEIRSSLAEVVATQEAAIARAVAASEEDKSRSVMILWIIAGLTLAAVTALAAWMTRRIARQLSDLALRVDSAAHDILAVVRQQVSGASEQSAAVQQTVATVDELVQTAEQAVERAQTVAQRAQESAKVADEGNRAVEDSTAGMLRIRHQVEAIAETIVDLTSRAQLIADVVNTVDSIAAETHLLALNAAIEAARAGEHGRGFAVVAGEVQNLAGQSKAATAQVSGILSEIEHGTDAAVVATEEGTKSSESGSELISRAGLTIQQLAATISSASLAAEQIAASSRQQAAATVQISDAMRNVSTVMDQNVAAARQSEETARGLTDAARDMKLLVGAE